MESYSTIIGVVITLIVLIPLVLIQFSQKNKKKKSKKAFLNEALKNNLKIDAPDFWGTYYAIAIDNTANKLIYSKIINTERNTTVIDLNEIDNCEIIKTNRTYKGKKTTKVETDKIDLIINYKTSKKPKEVLEFYNVDINFEMSNELSLIEKWDTKIKNRFIKKTQAA